MMGRRSAKLSTAEWEQALDLFGQCLSVPAEEREEFLRARAPTSEAVREEVRSLLAESTQDVAQTKISTREVPVIHSGSTIFSSDGPAGLPRRIGRYLLLEHLGAGGMAEVFLGRVIGAGGFEKPVAIKHIPNRFANEESARRLFEREAIVCSHLNHPNIVHTHDFVSFEGEYYLVMEYVNGENARTLIDRLATARARMTSACALYLVMEVCRGLEYAHSRRDPETGRPLGIIHRDISPKNVMISKEGEIKIIDFGIALAQGISRVTGVGDVRGTPHYMSPEQAKGERIDARSDIFSLAVMLYELLAGEPLFLQEQLHATLSAIIDGSIAEARIRAMEVAPELKNILLRATAPDRELRYPNISAFLSDLEIYADRMAIKPSRAEFRNLVSRHTGEVQPPPLSPTRVSLETRRSLSFPTTLREEIPGRGRGNSPRGQYWVAAALCLGLFFIAKKWFPQTAEPPSGEAPPVNLRANVDDRLRELAASPSPLVSSAPTWCELRVETLPSGAEVRLDGATAGKTPTTLRMACGKPMRMMLVKPGYQRYEAEIALEEQLASLKHSFIRE